MQGLSGQIVAPEETKEDLNDEQNEEEGQDGDAAEAVEDQEEGQEEQEQSGEQDAVEVANNPNEDQERYNSIDARICGQLEDRLHAFEGLAMQSMHSPEDVISARI